MWKINIPGTETPHFLCCVSLWCGSLKQLSSGIKKNKEIEQTKTLAKQLTIFSVWPFKILKSLGFFLGGEGGVPNCVNVNKQKNWSKTTLNYLALSQYPYHQTFIWYFYVPLKRSLQKKKKNSPSQISLLQREEENYFQQNLCESTVPRRFRSRFWWTVLCNTSGVLLLKTRATVVWAWVGWCDKRPAWPTPRERFRWEICFVDVIQGIK